MSNDAAKKTIESNRICFIKVIECLQYLAQQGQAMQGDTSTMLKQTLFSYLN